MALPYACGCAIAGTAIRATSRPISLSLNTGSMAPAMCSGWSPCAHTPTLPCYVLGLGPLRAYARLFGIDRAPFKSPLPIDHALAHSIIIPYTEAANIFEPEFDPSALHFFDARHRSECCLLYTSPSPRD